MSCKKYVNQEPKMMNRIISVCKLIRLPFLFVAAFIMFATRMLILSPILSLVNHKVQLPTYLFIILVFSVLLLIAAAYIINDYFDTKNDRITRTTNTIVGRQIKRRSAIKLHTTLNILAIIGSFFVSYMVGYLRLGILFVLASGLIWFYCTSYKRHIILGKVIVSAMIAGIPLIVFLFEVPLLTIKYAQFIQETGVSLLYLLDWPLGFAFLLFLSSLIMNLTKDTIKTMILNEGKISLAIKIALTLSYILLIALANFLSITIFNLSPITQYYLVFFGVLLPLVSLINLLTNNKLKYVKINYAFSKFIVLAMLGFTFFAHYVITNNLL